MPVDLLMFGCWDDADCYKPGRFWFVGLLENNDFGEPRLGWGANRLSIRHSIRPCGPTHEGTNRREGGLIFV